MCVIVYICYITIYRFYKSKSEGLSTLFDSLNGDKNKQDARSEQNRSNKKN